MVLKAIAGQRSMADQRLVGLALMMMGTLVFLRVMGAPLHWSGVPFRWSLLVWAAGIGFWYWMACEVAPLTRYRISPEAAAECFDHQRPAVTWLVMVGALITGAALALVIGQWLAMVGAALAT